MSHTWQCITWTWTDQSQEDCLVVNIHGGGYGQGLDRVRPGHRPKEVRGKEAEPHGKATAAAVGVDEARCHRQKENPKDVALSVFQFGVGRWTNGFLVEKEIILRTSQASEELFQQPARRVVKHRGSLDTLGV